MNTAEFLTISAAVVPDRAALVAGETRISYAQMQSRVTRLANALSGACAYAESAGAIATNPFRSA